VKNTVVCEKIATIEAQGSITAANAEIFKQQLLETLVSQPASILLVDLGQVEFLDSAGLMSLVAAYRLARSLDRRLSLCSVSPSVRIVLELTQLDGTFEMYENREAFEVAIAHI
jgi:anti-sigma B factor antagonist